MLPPHANSFPAGPLSNRCSTPEAIAWDPKWATTAGDISGRAVDVHDSSGGFKLEQDAKLKTAGAVRTTASLVQAAAPARSGRAAGIAPRARAQRRLPAFVGMRPHFAFI